MSNSLKHRIIIGIIDAVCGVLISIFSLVFIANTTIMVKSVGTERPQGFAGLVPVVIKSASMSGEKEGHLEKGDIALVSDKSNQSYIEGDVVLYMNEDTPVCHRIVQVKIDDNGNKTYVAKGDKNDCVDLGDISEDAIIGKVTGRLPHLGSIINFMASPLGMIICIIIPLAIIGLIFFRGSKKKAFKVTE